MTKYKLVIAEKPSVGMAYAVVLGAKKRITVFRLQFHSFESSRADTQVCPCISGLDIPRLV